MASLSTPLPNDILSFSPKDDQALLAVSEIIHKISLYISSSHLRRQLKDDSAAPLGIGLLSCYSDHGVADTSNNLQNISYDITNIVPHSLPGEQSPAKALLVDQLNSLIQSTSSLFVNNHSSSTQTKSAISELQPIAHQNNQEKSSFQQSLFSFSQSSPTSESSSSEPSSESIHTIASNDNDNDNDSSNECLYKKSLLSALFNKVQFQQNEIEMQRATVLALESDLEHARSTISAITQSLHPDQRRFIDTDLLDRELTKSQNANKAFQKALREIGEVVIAVAQGDLSKKVTVHAQEMDPEIIKFKETINTMMDHLQRFASEVTRVATEVAGGTLGGQAEGEGTVGVWRELTDNVNVMASNLTNQVREIADVTRAVAQGDLSRKINVHAQGEILELQKTINSMVDQLRTFAFEVTRVARETGVEGRLGGQAQIDGVEGIWRELTDNGK